MNIVAFILKVLVLSALMAAAIKYGGPYLNLPASNVGVLIAVFLPSVVMASLFGWMAYRT